MDATDTLFPDTEIDWRAYMQQVSQVLSGERNYLKISGSTGPLVYPAGHVWIYSLLSYITDDGTDIPQAQLLFAELYLATLAVVIACYVHARAPPYILPLLVLSKRLHSIYVLRLFNDGWAVLGLWFAILMFQMGHVRVGALAFSLGLAVKMSLLLAMPAVVVLLYMMQGPWGAVSSLFVMVQYQVLVAWPFLLKYPKEYLGRAFEFNRVFMFKWTVNWRFVGEETFLSKEFSTALLVMHASLLALFVTTRWIRPTRMSLWQIATSFFGHAPSKQQQEAMARRLTPDFVLCTIMSANAIGILCARSLHYQFYAWLAWGTPYMLWRSGWGPLVIFPVWLAQEISWNVYPSTFASSATVVACAAIQVLGLWVGSGRESRSTVSKRSASAKDRPGAGRQK